MKTDFTKRRYKARKQSSCALCKLHQRGREGKKTIQDLRQAVKHG